MPKRDDCNPFFDSYGSRCCQLLLIRPQYFKALTQHHERLVDITRLLQPIASSMRVLIPLRASEIDNSESGDLSGIRILGSAIVDTDDLDGENAMAAAGFSVRKGTEHLPSILARSEDRKSLLQGRDLSLARAWRRLNWLTSLVRTRTSFSPAIYFPFPSGSFFKLRACLLSTPPPPFAMAAMLKEELRTDGIPCM